MRRGWGRRRRRDKLRLMVMMMMMRIMARRHDKCAGAVIFQDGAAQSGRPEGVERETRCRRRGRRRVAGQRRQRRRHVHGETVAVATRIAGAVVVGEGVPVVAGTEAASGGGSGAVSGGRGGRASRRGGGDGGDAGGRRGQPPSASVAVCARWPRMGALGRETSRKTTAETILFPHGQIGMRATGEDGMVGWYWGEQQQRRPYHDSLAKRG